MVLTFPLPAGTVVKGPGGSVWFAVQYETDPDDDTPTQIVLSIQGFDMGSARSRIVSDFLDQNMMLLHANAEVTELTEESDLPTIQAAYKRWTFFKNHDVRKPLYKLFSDEVIPAFLRLYPQVSAARTPLASAFCDH